MHARDPAELYKDKIEVSLDGRQIFYLFFGGAVVVGMVFVLGVMVGRRVEARGHIDPARTAAGSDPLAALDRLEGPERLSFKGALTGAQPQGTQPQAEVERAVDELGKARGVKAEPAPAPKKAAEAKVEKKAEKAEHAEKAERAEKAEKAERAEKTERAEKAERAERTRSSDKSERAEPRDSRDAKDTKDTKDAKDAKDSRDSKDTKDTKDAKDAKDSRDSKDSKDSKDSRKKKKADGESADAGTGTSNGKFTLQLSAFQDRQEADTFLSTLKAAGFQAYLTEADVGGKGTFYRVRIGTYRSAEAAADAKAELERITKKNASVMRL